MPNNMDITVHNLHKGHRETILPIEARSGDTYNKGEKGQKRTRELETNNTTKHTLQDNSSNTGKKFNKKYCQKS